MMRMEICFLTHMKNNEIRATQSSHGAICARIFYWIKFLVPLMNRQVSLMLRFIIRVSLFER